ncbi:hypothetical protein [Pseudarthrobacter sp. Y6]|uniref:hypothetical protein n=1 Tax=Pseudarthrobacter sp. Y6 TaxID=3418422 RepID=UPI003CEF2795
MNLPASPPFSCGDKSSVDRQLHDLRRVGSSLDQFLGEPAGDRNCDARLLSITRAKPGGVEFFFTKACAFVVGFLLMD